jgi:hypothetical protein
VVQHHIHTNDVHKDPDISGSAYLRLNPLKPLLHYHVVQHVYFFLLLALYGFLVVGQSLGEMAYVPILTKRRTYGMMINLSIIRIDDS